MDNTKDYILSPYISEKFKGILERYNAERVLKDRTEQQYIYVFNALCDHAKCDFLDITAAQIRDYFTNVQNKKKVRSTDYGLNVLRSVSRYIDMNAGELELEPRYLSLFSSLEVILPDFQFDPESLPDLASVDKVLTYFKDSGDMTGFLSCAFVLRCSLTTNELVSLTRSMLIQDANGNYGIRMQLTNHAVRFVKIPEDLVGIIRKYAAQRTDSLPNFFLNKKGKPISARALQNRLSEACQAAEVTPFTYNDLRTLSQAIMIKDGAPLDKVAQLTNLKQTDWFFRYNRVVEELQESAVDFAHIKIEW